MKIVFKVEMGQLVPYSTDDKQSLSNLKDGVYEVDIKNMDMRTILQNSAIHLWCSQIATLLNNSGLHINDVLKIKALGAWRKSKKTFLKKL